jgi:hypothetical protein
LLVDAGNDGWLAGLPGSTPTEPAAFLALQAAIARLYEDLFAIDITLIDHPYHRYNAACAAALAGCGQGKDADKLDDKEHARLRKQAIAWLRADLARWTKQAASAKPSDRGFVLKTLNHWQSDTDLAGIRDRDAVPKLPANERETCRQLWADVAQLRKKVEPKQ